MNTSESASDEELVRLYQSNNDQEIIGTIYTRYSHLVFGACLKKLQDKEMAKDETMQIFERLGQAIAKSDIQKFNAWIYSLTNNACITRLRKLQVEQKHISPWTDKADGEIDDGYSEVQNETELQEQKVRWAVTQLATEQADCIRLFYFDNKSYKEIAHITGMIEGLVKSHLQNGKRNLKILLSSKSNNG